MLFDYVTSTQQLITIFNFLFGSLEERLHEFKYYESERLVRYLKKEFDKKIYITPDEIRSLIKRYMREQGD